jgi:hypothetical protein
MQKSSAEYQVIAKSGDTKKFPRPLDTVKGGPVSLRRRALLFLGTAELFRLIVSLPCTSFAKTSTQDYSSLVELTRLQPIEKPLLVFRDHEKEPDQETRVRIIGDLRRRPDFLKQIIKRLDGEKKIRFTFDSLEIKLLFVPELRKKYLQPYRTFCTNVIDYLQQKTGLQSPYEQIIYPLKEYPKIPLKGTYAYLVHQLGKEYRALCTFSTERGTSVRYEFEGSYFSDHLGGVEVNIENPCEGTFILDRKNYSIWQNRTTSLYSLLTVPVEETFHFVMGKYTDQKIAAELGKKSNRSVTEIEKVAKYWMSVEEALVGGLSWSVIKDFARKFLKNLPPSASRRIPSQNSRASQYAFRETGFSLVKSLGFKEAISMYQNDPTDFCRLLTKSQRV